MKKDKNKNAGSFFTISEIDKGHVSAKYNLPKGCFKPFDMKTNLMKVPIKNIFYVDDEFKDVFDKLNKK